jgi:tetratricopeptide (TPR) repeat protein
MTKTICLNMIVKDESHIIEETLNNLVKNLSFDYWVISDTGSSDDTIQIIQEFFREKQIPGELFKDIWVNFGYNRTLGLQHAFDKTDYIFIFDADDLINGNFILPSPLNKDKYNIPFESPISYHRSILISNRMKWKYKGVLHEYIVNVDPVKSEETIVNKDYWIQSRRLGSRNNNPLKYHDDAIILEKGYLSEHRDIHLKYRYSYYCARSYRDAGETENAIKWFKNTISLQGCRQHSYSSCIALGDCYMKIDKPQEAIEQWGRSYNYDHERLEGIVKIMEYYYSIDLHFMVVSLYHKFKFVNIDCFNVESKIFLDYLKYIEFYYFTSISAGYCDEPETGYTTCKYLLLNNWKYIENTISNLKFYSQFLITDPNNKQLIDFFVIYIKNSSRTELEIFNAWEVIKDTVNVQYHDIYLDITSTINQSHMIRNN